MWKTASTCGPLVAAVMCVGASHGGENPAVIGQWDPPTKWPVIAIHAAMLPSGKVLHWSFPNDTPGSAALLWDPETSNFTQANMSTDIFCAGLAILPNGSLLVSGGNDYNCPEGPQGRRTTFTFDPFAEAWVFQSLMGNGRWYPTNVPLGDGSVLIFSGINLNCGLNPYVERFVLGEQIQYELPSFRFLELYPRMHLLTSGKVAHVGEEIVTYLFDVDTGWEFVTEMILGEPRCEGTSVLIPGRTDQILTVGGNCPVTATAEIIDFSSPAPQWQATASMHHARAHADALILPDATVLVVGGGTIDAYGGLVFVPERFDPETETWQNMAPHQLGRAYHATTVLLPDARVLVAGQDSGPSAFLGQIYSPPYLFQGPRPNLVAAPDRVAYDRAFSTKVTQAAWIQSVALIAPSTVTHSVNTTQRYVGLDFEVIGGGVLQVTGPLNGNHAPPGYYMLFAVNQDGVPSIADWVQVGDWLLGDVDGNGVVGIGDFLAVLAAWGPCAGCDADVDGDGVVGIIDLLIVLANWT